MAEKRKLYSIEYLPLVKRDTASSKISLNSPLGAVVPRSTRIPEYGNAKIIGSIPVAQDETLSCAVNKQEDDVTSRFHRADFIHQEAGNDFTNGSYFFQPPSQQHWVAQILCSRC
ncbi:hypothetical protein BGAL_0070g00080 [Botrytis galanthina]|uniref:Uncharacterized protein n=1 Tax=Botrytis galanthina TaxID=278940 RepID=A0A4S8R484_9HELO|nr:hypothetical protein BGAL_0070g00080 [Botrytis galanthina]